MSQSPHQQPHQPQPPQLGPPQKPRRNVKKVVLISAGSVVVLFIVLAIIGAIIGSPKTTKTADTAPATTAATTSAATHTASPAAAPAVRTSAKPAATTHSPAPAAPITFADTLTSYGATLTTWDASHTADTQFAAGSVFDPNPALPQINGNEGARYTAVTPLGGLVEDYTVNEMAGTSVTAGFADVVSRELPSDTVVLWKRDQSADGCYQEEVQSKVLQRILGGQGAVLLEAQSADPSTFDASNVATVMVTPGDDSVSEADAPGC